MNIIYFSTINKDKNTPDVSVKMTGLSKFKYMEYERASDVGERAKILAKEYKQNFVNNSKSFIGIDEKVDSQTADDRFAYLKEAI